MAVTIYSTPTCIWCKKTKEFFRAHKIKFTEKDVSENVENAKEMIKISGQRGTPVIKANGKIIIGFNESELKKALKIK